MQSRYYDPIVKRFLNADSYASTGQGFLGHNMFAYCNNNPVDSCDQSGNIKERNLGYGEEFGGGPLADGTALSLSPGYSITYQASSSSTSSYSSDISYYSYSSSPSTSSSYYSTDYQGYVTFTQVAYDADFAGVSPDGGGYAGWHVGEDITMPTRAGNVPSWTTLRQRYWKNVAYFTPDLYPGQLNRLTKGLAPLDDTNIPFELHHPFGRTGENFFYFYPLTQYEHRIEHYGG